MNSFVVAPEAEEDIFHIWLYLLREAGMEMANRIEEEILEARANLAETPGKGHRRPDLTSRNVLCSGATWQTQREAASQSAADPALDSSITPPCIARRIIAD